MLKWISTRDMSREDWLKARKQGIGGSDAAAIMEATNLPAPCPCIWTSSTSCRKSP